MNSNTKFALFGHGIHLCYMAKELINRGFDKPVIITHAREQHYRDRVLLNDKNLHEDVFEIALKFGIPIIDVAKVNSESVYDFLNKHACNIGFSLSCRSIIKRPIIDFFKGSLFNIHPSFLPNERGSGTFSWRILNGSNEVSGTIHYIDEGIDTGNIVLQKKILLSKKKPTPYDFLVNTTELSKNLINNFLDNVTTIVKSNGICQSEFEGSYFPRLITENNGAIDWTISGDLIEKTIRAFSGPYPGAFTYINGQKISILESKFEMFSHGMHPISYGRVIGFSNNDSAKVIVKEGFIYISEIILSGSNSPHKIIDFFQHPIQFHTPYNEIDKAKYKRVSFSELGRNTNSSTIIDQ